VVVGVAVNLSALDLAAPGLAEVLRGLLERHALPPERLLLEITESAVMQDVEQSLRMLERLRGLGLRLAIDDFGTGQSSLAQLKRLPVHELKIDKGFVMRLDTQADDALIVRSTIDIAHNMGLEVVAEGVESEAGARMLEAFGCDLLQGYWISRPLPGPALLAWALAQPGMAGAGTGLVGEGRA
jgi:EAL domain-containing protein (putative c-di-GMP-specific phosphodiesterase class I)